MFDTLLNSADGLFVIIFIIFFVVFFLFGPHKIYESLFGALLGLGLYLFVHEMTFIFPEITKTVFLGNWLFNNRGTILWISKILIIILFFITPITVGLNVSGVMRGTFWFFLKTIFLTAFFVCFGIIVASLLSTKSGVFGDVSILHKSLGEYVYFQNSHFYIWISDKTGVFILGAYSLTFYKILFSHWITRVLFFGGLIYAKSNEVFGKKSLDPVMHLDTHEHDDQSAVHH